MFEGVGSIRGRVTGKCHARRVEILFLVDHYRLKTATVLKRYRASVKNVAELDLKSWIDMSAINSLFENTNRLAIISSVSFLSLFFLYTHTHINVYIYISMYFRTDKLIIIKLSKRKRAICDVKDF